MTRLSAVALYVVLAGCLLPLTLRAQNGNLVVTQTGQGQLNGPGTPFNFGSTTPMSIEIAYDHFHISPNDGTMIVSAGSYWYAQQFGIRTAAAGTHLKCYYTMDGGGDGEPEIDISGWQQGSGGADYGMSVVCERDPSRQKITMRICHMDGTGCVQDSRNTPFFGSGSYAGAAIGPAGVGGNDPIYGDLSLFRIRSTLYNGQGLLSGAALVPPNASNAVHGNLLNSEFASNLTDDVTGNSWIIDFPNSYTATNPHPPVCNAGNSRTQRAGKPLQLDGSASYALDGTTTVLNYVWSQTGGPSELAWTSHSAMSPAPGGSIFGQYDFALTIKDTTGGSASCGVSHGAVATDSKGNLLIQNPTHAWILTNSDPANPAPHTGSPSLLGPEYIPDGTGIRAFPFFQSQIPINAANLYNAIVAPYTETTIPGPGTISFNPSCTNWSTATSNPACSVITGSGTTFKSTFCGGTTIGPNPDTGAWIVIWYKSLLVNGTGRRLMPIKSCDTDTQITLGRTTDGGIWSFISEPGVVDTSCGSSGCTSGVQYSLYTYTNSAWWFYGSAPGAYYDTPLAYYYLWYATGLNYWRDAARDYADKWCLEPHFDCGAQYTPDAGWWYLSGSQARSVSLLSLIMRATDGRSDMWPGIRRILNFEIPSIIPPGEVYDLREASYVTLWTAMLAKLDPDSAQRAAWYTKLQSQFTNTWTPFSVSKSYGMYWLGKTNGRDPQTNYDGRSSTNITEFVKRVSGTIAGQPHIYTGTANVINLNANVTGTGTNFLTTFDQTGNYGTSTDVIYADQSGSSGCKPNSFIWFQPDTGSSTHAFTPNIDFNGDTRAYRISAITDNTHMTLSEPYQGSTGSKNYICGTSPTSSMISAVQPYMLSIAMQAFYWSEIAAQANSDTTLASTAHTYAAGAAQYLLEHSYEPNLGGQPYIRTSPSCEMSTRSDNASCCEQAPEPCFLNPPGAYTDQNANRTNGIESMHHLSVYCRYVNCDASHINTMYHRFAESWGKPGTGAMISDPNYVISLDHEWSNPSAQTPQKWLGYCAGTGLNQSVLSALDGGTLQKAPRTIRVVYNAAAHPLATKARMTVTDPTGAVTETTTCTSSPCVLTTPDSRAGNHLVQIDLLNASNAVVMPGRPIRLEVQ